MQGTDKGVVLYRYVYPCVYIYFLFIYLYRVQATTKPHECIEVVSDEEGRGRSVCIHAYLQLNTFRSCGFFVRTPQHTTGRWTASPAYSGKLPRHFDIGVRVHYRHAILSHLMSRQHQAVMISGTAAITPMTHQPRLVKKPASNSEVLYNMLS